MNSHIIWLPLLLIAVIALHGCSPREPSRVRAIRGDAQLHQVSPVIGEWIALWQTAMPGFAADSLIPAGSTRALNGGYVQPLAAIPSEQRQSVVFQALGAESPDHRYKLVFDWYQAITEDSGEYDIGGEPDSAPLLIDVKDGVANQFMSCGTVCGFDWGAWVSSTKFVLGGWQELDSKGSRYQGKLNIFSIPDSSTTVYLTRPVSQSEFMAYKEAWERWVVSRLRSSDRRAGN